jgi:hypothetical protein
VGSAARMALTRRSTSIELSLAALSVKKMTTLETPSTELDWM